MDPELILKLFAGMDDRFQSRMDKFEEKLDAARMDIVSLKVKAGMTGAAAGAVLALLVSFLGKVLHVG